MGVTKEIINDGDGKTFPKVGDVVSIDYNGYLLDPQAADKKGKLFDSSSKRNEDFKTVIGVGQVIKGWDEGVITMSLGEKARLTISSDYAYGERGFPGHIPAYAALIFDVELRKIDSKS